VTCFVKEPLPAKRKRWTTEKEKNLQKMIFNVWVYIVQHEDQKNNK